MLRRSAAPLLIGTFVLRSSSGAGTVILGLFLAQLTAHGSRAITSIDVGLIAVAFSITELSFAPFMGALSDRWGRRYFLIIGPLLGLIGVALLLFTPTRDPLPYLLSIQMLGGLSSAMQVPTVLGYLADYTAQNQENRMRIMSFYELATSGGIGVGVVLGGFIWDHFGKLSFAVLASFYMIVAICMSLAPKVKQVVERGKLQTLATRYWHILRTPRLFIFIPAWISVSAIVGVWLSSQLPFILSVHRHNPHQILVGSMSGVGSGGHLSLILGAFAIFFGLCLLFWAFFLNRLPRLVLMLTSILGVYLFCIAMTGINHRGVGHDALLVIWTPVLLIGVFAETSFAPAALAYLADISESTIKDRGLIMGLYSVFLGLGQLFGSGLGGVFARSFDFDGLIYLTALLACIALACLLYLHWYEKRHLAPVQQKPA